MKFIKQFFLLLAFALYTFTLQAQQAPGGINYQAVLRDQQGQIVAGKPISLRLAITSPEGQEVFYEEIHQITTSNAGMFSLVIGEGKMTAKGAFKDIPWATSNTWLEVAYDLEGDGSYEISGATRLLSVPYALYAEKSGSVAGGGSADDPKNDGAEGGEELDWWGKKGSPDVDESYMYLGTINYADLVVKTNEIERFRVTKDGAIDFSFAPAMFVGAINIDGTLLVTGDVRFQSNLEVERSVGILEDLKVEGMTDIRGLYAKEDAHFGQDVQIDKNLNIDFDVHVGQDLDVDRDANIDRNLHVGNDADIDHDLNVDNDGHFGNDLDVDRNLNVDVDAHIGQDLDVDRDANVDRNLNVDVDVHIGNDLDVDHNVNIDNDLTVKNNAFINGDLDVDGTGTFFDLMVERDLKVGRDADVDRNLNVDVDAHIGQDLDVDRNAKIDADLNVGHNAHIAQDLGVGRDLDIDRNLQVDQSATINDDLIVNDDLSVGSDMTVYGPIKANCSLRVVSCVNGADSDPENYPVYISGGDQGVYIQVAGTRSSVNNYVTFADASGIQGRVEGQTLFELHTSFEYIWAHSMSAAELALKIAMVAACIAQADVGEVIVWGAEGAVQITKWTEWAVSKENKIGVAYESGSGDYAEWLERAIPADVLHYGEIVGVRGGKISRSTEGADHVMVISMAPIVLGNMPEAGREKDFEKVAFMGQVPVRVMGRVAVGDYILASGNNDGLGRAVNPADMHTEDFARIVGVAWEASDNPMGAMVNVAVGINTNDMAGRLAQQERELAGVKAQVNQLFALLGQKAPYEGLAAVASTQGNLGKNTLVQPVLAGNKTQQHDLDQAFEARRAEIEAVFAKYRVELEKQGLDVNRYPDLAAIYNNPVQWMKDQNAKGYLDQLTAKGAGK